MDIKINDEAQVIEFVEGGEVVAGLSYAEATRKGFRCSVAYEDVVLLDDQQKVVLRKNDSGELAPVCVGQKRIGSPPDGSKLSATRATMPVKLRDGTEVQVACVRVMNGDKLLTDVMLPLGDLEI